MAAARRALVILRAGDQSLHPEWFTNARPESRNWDFHISYFGTSAVRFAIATLT